MKHAAFALLLCVAACKREPEPQSRPTPAAPPRQQEIAKPAPPPVPPAPVRLPAAPRVIAIGDLHGDIDQARAALRLGGAVDKEDDWVGGKLVVVQLGDELDRGDGDEGIVELFDSLADKAKQAGGAVMALDGNHEVMNVQGDFRYTTKGGFEAFAHFSPAGAAPPALEAFPAFARGRAYAFLPGGRFARLLAKRNVIEIVGDAVFVHGGVLPAHVEYGIERIDAETAAWMRGERAQLPAPMQGDSAPIWTRAYSDGDPSSAACAELAQVLDRLHVKRMVVGHTVQKDGINAACDGRVWRTDVGLSHFYGGPTQVLELAGDKVRVLDAAHATVQK